MQVTEDGQQVHTVSATFYGVATTVVVPTARDADHLRYYFRDYLSPDDVAADVTVELASDAPIPFVEALTQLNVKTVRYRYPCTDTWTTYESFTLRASKPALLPPFGISPLREKFQLRHGGAVRAPGTDQALVVLGESGAGKSVLTLSMQHRGWSLVTDDVLVIGRQDRLLRYHGRPLGIRSRSLPVLSWLDDTSLHGAPVVRTGSGDTHMVRPETLGPVVGVAETVRPAWAARLRRSRTFQVERDRSVLHVGWDPAKHLPDLLDATDELVMARAMP